MDIETSKNDNNLDESYEEDNFEMNSEIIEEKTTPENYSTDEYNNIIMYDSDIDDCYRSFEEDLNEDLDVIKIIMRILMNVMKI